jgi:hypothetical protein
LLELPELEVAVVWLDRRARDCSWERMLARALSKVGEYWRAFASRTMTMLATS